MLEPPPSRRLVTRAGASTVGRERRPILIIGGNPAIDRVHLVGRTTLWVLTASLCAAIILSVLAIAATPMGWLVTAAAALVGLVAPWGWQRFRRVDADRLAVWHLAPRWAEPVTRAATQAERLHRLAERAPSGPVAQHFEQLAETADGYVRALYEAALQADAVTSGDPGSSDSELEADMREINAGLADLVAAAERLRVAQQRHLTPSPLAELTAETDRLAMALDDDRLGAAVPRDSTPSGGSPSPRTKPESS